MIGLIICLGILPYLYGSIFLSEEKSSKLLRFPVGLLVEFVIWTVVALPTELLGGAVSTAISIFVVCNIPVLLSGARNFVQWIRMDGIKKLDWHKYVPYLKNVGFMIMLAVILFQAGRATFFKYDYGDDRVYVAMVNDMVETDAFYPYVDETGAVQDFNEIPKKYLLSSWYTFETMLSKVSGIKPLMLIYTMLPGYLILSMYIIWWGLADLFFRHRLDGKIGLIIVLALLFELNSEDVSSFVLNWPTYGKNITANFVMPLLTLFWMYNEKKREWKRECYLWLLMFAGCAASTMGLMMMPIEASLLTGIEMWRQENGKFFLLLRWLILLVPALVYAILFIS